MARARNRDEELRDLARRLYRLMREHEIAHHTRLKVNGPVSRILKHAPEWRALRRVNEKNNDARAAKDPSFFTLVDVARDLQVPICAFVPTMAHQPLTDVQRKLLTLAARWMLANFAPRAEERGAYTSDFEDFAEYVAFEKLEYESAAGRSGPDEQLLPQSVEVDGSLTGIRSDRFQVTTVRGDSMAHRLRHGDRVLVDVYRRTPANGEMIVVERGHLGRAIGYWLRDGTRSLLEKENETTIDLGAPNDYTILGTVTGIVWSPISRRRR